MMMPATLAIIRTTFIDPRERALALGLWAGVASAGMAAGPLVAGLLLDALRLGRGVPHQCASGRAGAVWRAVGDSKPRVRAWWPAWDITGSLQLLLALTALMYAIKEPARQDWSALRLMLALLLAAGGFASVPARPAATRAAAAGLLAVPPAQPRWRFRGRMPAARLAPWGWNW